MSALAALAARPITLRVGRPRLAASVVVLTGLALVLAPRFLAAGSPMDEGGVLAYADRILAGQVPARDLHSFYGPLGTYLLAGVFKLAGPSLAAERAVGFAYRIVLAGALLWLVRRRGVRAIFAAGALLALMLPSQGIAAFATYGALACSCTSIALADARRPFVAGLVAGVALLMRFDWALPVALSAIPYVAVWSWRGRVRALAGASLGALAYVPYLTVIGAARTELWAQQLRDGQTGRRLPLPAWSTGNGHLLALTLASVLLAAIVGLRRRRSPEGVALCSVALLGVGLLPYAVVRPDRAHLLVAAIAPVAVLGAVVPAALAELGRVRRVVVALAFCLAAFGYVAVSVGVAHDYGPLLSADVASAAFASTKSYPVVHDGRSFRIADPRAARDAERAVTRADAVAPEGGSVFVGPGDLRRTDYSDAYIYFLLPRLRPATFYITLDPGATEQPGVRLASELRHASVLVLNAAYDDPLEANARAEAFGSVAPNRVVARDFCRRGTYGTFRVYARCQR